MVVILGGGGFFFYYSQQRLVFDNLDSQLLTTAQYIASSYRGIPTAPSTTESVCRSFNQLSRHDEGEIALALYSADGDLLCSNHNQLSNLLNLAPKIKSGSLSKAKLFATNAVNSSALFRQLTYPIINNGKVIYHLQLGQSLAAQERYLQQLILLLFLAGLTAIICFAAAQWMLLGLLTKPLARMTRQMGKTCEENLQQKFSVPPQAGEELLSLADNYNDLIEHLRLILQRSRQFTADVTHELRTPLTILRGETELALRGEKKPEELREILNSNLEEISRMAHMVDDLLLLSKSELDEIPLKMEALNLGDLLEELHFQGQIIAEPKNIQVGLQGPDNQISLLADPHRLRQVFLNLLTNAIKYTPEGGSVMIDWSLQGDAARIIFTDTGIGIDSKHQQYIFDRFYRIDKTGNRDDGGSGLGLAIAKWLIEAHGGSIRVCSVPGQGSSFAIRLPLTGKQKKPSV